MLKIQISGHVASGKTTIATIIANALAANGITVRNLDPDVIYGTDYPHNQELRVAAVAKRSQAESVLLEVVQLHRSFVANEGHE